MLFQKQALFITYCFDIRPVLGKKNPTLRNKTGVCIFWTPVKHIMFVILGLYKTLDLTFLHSSLCYLLMSTYYEIQLTEALFVWQVGPFWVVFTWFVLSGAHEVTSNFSSLERKGYVKFKTFKDLFFNPHIKHFYTYFGASCPLIHCATCRSEQDMKPQIAPDGCSIAVWECM